jgi:hypothetical protein
MLISASYFWSDALNAFLFGHGPMTPTLLDVMMLTGLDISAPDRSYDLLSKTDFKLDTKNIGGWKGYVEKYSKSGAANTREHAAFLNMWLEKYLFCGKTVGPTSNNLKLAENLAHGNNIPLGKHLLGSVYRLLHQISARLRANQPIINLGGPWWFIQLWLNTYMHKVMGLNLRTTSFPSESYAEGQPIQLRRCTSFGEAAILITNDTLSVTDFFRCFYHGFADEAIIWFAYHDDNHDFENPVKFQLDNWSGDDYATNSLREAIAPRILPATFTSGRDHPSYEFYHPSAVARQLGFGQVPIQLFFADKVQAREIIKSGLSYNRVENLQPDVSDIDLIDWRIAPLTSVPFTRWWSEWHSHLFCLSASTYCKHLSADYMEPDDEV